MCKVVLLPLLLGLHVLYMYVSCAYDIVMSVIP